MKKLLIVVLLFCPGAFGTVTCLTVSASGAGSHTGADWNNSLAGIPSTLTRGDRYYLADGSYGSYTFNQSGTTSVELRKAQSYDFGRSADGCTVDVSAGWNSATMGAGQAVFATYRMLAVDSSGLILNGNGQQTTAGCGGAVGSDPSLLPANPKDCGILLDNKTACSSTAGGACTDSVSDGGNAISSFTMDYVEFRGMGNATSETYSMRADNSSNWTILHSYLHYLGTVCAVVGGTTNFTLDNSYIFRNQIVAGSNPGHGQCLQSGGDSGGMDVSRNVFRDMGGTAIIMSWVGSGSVQAGPYKFYDNAIWTTPGFTPLFPSANGILACINGFTCNNVTMSQNTIGLMGSAQVAIDSETGGTYTVQNNIWYSSSNNANPAPHGTFTQDHNSYLASGSSCPSGTGNVCNNSASSPFTSASTGDFTLAADGSNVNARTSLSAPFTTDAAGVTFTTDRGAFQFVSGSASFNATPSVIPANHSNNITVTLAGSGTAWTGSTAFSISGVTGATLTGKSNSSSTAETLTITTGSATGTLTITDTTDSISTTISVATASLAISPSAGNISTTPTLTMTGSSTVWTQETPAGLFSVSGGTGSSIGTPTVTSDTSATVVLTTGSGTATETITDTSTTATAAFTVATPTTPTVTSGTASSVTSSSAVINNSSYVCTGSCSVVTSEGVCYGLTANPTTPCTSNGTSTPFNSSLGSLSSTTVYHYRAFATNATGTAYGSDTTFTTTGTSGVLYLSSSSCSTGIQETGASATWSTSCTPTAAGDALAMFVQCHPTSGTITGITLTSPGWTINQIVPPASTGSNSWGAIFGAIAPNTSTATFTATFTGGSNCSNFSIFMGAEFSGNNPTGGTTTFNATGSASGSASTCNQTGANITPSINNEGVWYACLLGSATTATSPWTLGVTDGSGNSSEYQILSGGSGVAQTPAFNGSSGAYIVEGVAISSNTVPQAPMALSGVVAKGLVIQ